VIVQEDDLLQNSLFLAQVDVEHLIEQVEDYVLDVLAGKRCELLFNFYVELYSRPGLVVQALHILNFLCVSLDILLLQPQ